MNHCATSNFVHGVQFLVALLFTINGFLFVTSHAAAQTTVPPRWDDLPKLAATWPPAWAALVRDIQMPRDDFAKDALQRVNALLAAEPPSKENYRVAEITLVATLRHLQSLRQTAPLADNPAESLQAEIEGRLGLLRLDWLAHSQKEGSGAEALQLAERWLPAAASNDSLRTSILQLWHRQSKIALEKAEYAAARKWFNRIEAHAIDAEPIGKELRERAETFLKESQTQSDAAAIRMLEDALTLWPRLPDARDALERRKGTYKTLVVAVRSLPVLMSPGTASTEIEKQSLELLFDRLYHVEPQLGRRYRPQIATSLPNGSLIASVPLRRDGYWSNGDRLTAADLRLTALLMNQPDLAGRTALWRDFLEVPRLERNLLHLNVTYRQGLFDPIAPLTFWILPQNYRGKQLQNADDPDFARAPLGSGPFQYVGRKQHDSKTVAVFRANPHDLRHAPNSLREIRLTTWTDSRTDFSKPLPHLVLDAATDQLAAFKDQGYTEIDVKNSTCVYFLAVNHRKASLASATIRRTIAHAIDREGLLNRHFRSEALKGKYHAAANGLFPRESWANAPAPRVPQSLFQLEQARSFARKAAKESATLECSLKYPAGDTRVKAACEDIARAVLLLFKEAQVKASVSLIALQPHELRKTIHERDYDLLYTSAEGLNDPVQLAYLFDRSDDATRAGGSNFLGYDSDIKLQQLLQGVLQSRQFAAVEEGMQAVHVHLSETMPVIPLWHLDTHVLIHPTLSTPPLDPRAVFARVREWKVMPK